jgi:putative hydrolase of the HAD superfamily
MSNPRAILFDAGHTLVFIDPERSREIFHRAGVEVSADRFREAERTARGVLTGLVRDGNEGTEPELWHQYFVTLMVESGVPEDRRDAVGQGIRDGHREVHLWTGVDSRTPGALDALAEAGYRLAVISNADGRMEDALVRAGLRDHFEFVIDSEVVGVAKPDPAIFHVAAERLELDPAECLYVGDLFAVDVVGARGAGMAALLLDPLDMLDHPVDRIPAVADLPDYLAARVGA